MRWIRAVVLAATAALAAPRAMHAQQPPATRPADTAAIGISTDDLQTTINNPAAPSGNRIEAARRLVRRQSDQSRNALRTIVSSPGNPSARNIALSALADDANPDPRLLGDLVGLLTSATDPAALEPVAQALTAYRDNPQVVQTLAALSTDRLRQLPLRRPIVRALGSFIEQSAADALVNIATNPNEPASIVAEAADALAHLTGLDANGRDPQKWTQWRAQNANRPPGEWKADLLRARAAREDRMRRGADKTPDEFQLALEDAYNATPDASKSAKLLRYLRADAAMIRAVGARMADRVASNALSGENSPEVEQRLVEMIGDSDPDVRTDVARALYSINFDPDVVLAAFRAQLQVETDSDVKAAIARKLSNIPRLTQLSDLGKLLADVDPEVVTEAAAAIRKLAPNIKPADAALRTEAADKLREAIRRLAGREPLVGVRRACGDALAALRDGNSMDFARDILRDRREPQPIRGVALRILGELGPSALELIVRAVDDPASQFQVQVEGIEAIARTESFEQSGWLIQKMNARDAHPAVQKAAKDAYLSLLPKVSVQKLAAEANNRKKDFRLRVAVLQELVARLKASGSPEDLKNAAYQQQNIGVEYLDNLGMPAEAVPPLRDALAYFRKNDVSPDVTLRLVTQLVKAMLQNHQYAALTDVTEQLITPGSKEAATYQTEIGSRIRNEAESLLRSKAPADLDHASALIDAALKMDPPLTSLYREELTRFRTELEKRRQQNARATTTP